MAMLCYYAVKQWNRMMNPAIDSCKHIEIYKAIFSFCFMHMLLLLSRFSRVWLCATPYTAAHQASPSLGFSRQEHWSGLPFLSPMHESEKWKVKSLSRVRLLATSWTAACQAPPYMGFSRQEYCSGLPLPSPNSMHICIYTYICI